MWIVNLNKNPNNSHNHHSSPIITTVPDGCAMIPEDFPVPDTFPFVDIEAEEVTYYNEVEYSRKVVKKRDTGMVDEDGNAIMELYEDEETYTEQVPYTMMTVTSMTPGIVPEPVETVPEPTQLDRVEAQAAYTAMMTDTLLEV